MEKSRIYSRYGQYVKALDGFTVEVKQNLCPVHQRPEILNIYSFTTFTFLTIPLMCSAKLSCFLSAVQEKPRELQDCNLYGFMYYVNKLQFSVAFVQSINDQLPS